MSIEICCIMCSIVYTVLITMYCMDRIDCLERRIKYLEMKDD